MTGANARRADVDGLVREIRRDVQALSERKAEPLRAIRRAYTRRLREAPAEDVIALALRLLEAERGDLRFIAYELIHKHPGALRSLRERTLRRLAHGMASWDAVDTFAVYLSGPAWRAGQITDAVIHKWARSGLPRRRSSRNASPTGRGTASGATANLDDDRRWWRRAALVSTVPLNVKSQGGTGDARRTLAVCRILITDRDDMVVKALSWALRALAEREPAAVQKFVDEHRDVLARRVVREVTHKLETGRKN